jgi:hypothetical protein
MTFMNTIQQMTSQTYTENGDLTYSTTLNANLDFFASAGALRGDDEQAAKMFWDAFDEDPDLALKNLFYLRDIRGGKGERSIFRTILKQLAEKHPLIALRLVPAVIQYGRWDDILLLVDVSGTRPQVEILIRDQLTEDLQNKKEGKGISLCAKWMPSINTSSKEAVRIARRLARDIGWSEKQYRKTLSELRKGEIVERYISEKDYTFDYAKIPGKALMKYIDCWHRNDEERYQAYLRSLKEGKTAAKVKAVYPYEIINVKDEDLREELWKGIERGSHEGRTIVVRDGSGSMTWGGRTTVIPLDVATSLAILFSEQLTGEFKDKFILMMDEVTRLLKIDQVFVISHNINTEQFSNIINRIDLI